MRRLPVAAVPQLLLLGLLSGVLPGCASTENGGGETGHKYVVFFDTGSARIMAPADDVVSLAAAVAKRNPDTTVMVAGYAAAHGNIDADQALSASRADAVAAGLEADGVPAARVRENPRPPSNEQPAVAARRVEISFVATSG